MKPLRNACLSILRKPTHPNNVNNTSSISTRFSSMPTKNKVTRVGQGVPAEEMPYHHFFPKNMKPTDTVKQEKFVSPRKQANKMFALINDEAINKSKEARPNVHHVPFRVGDSIEITMVSEGGVNSNKLEKIRGVVLGRINRGLGSSCYIRDVVFGEPIDRKIPLHSPMLKSIKVLEQNFVFRGKRRIKRAKLYYLRDRLPQGKVSFSFVEVIQIFWYHVS